MFLQCQKPLSNFLEVEEGNLRKYFSPNYDRKTNLYATSISEDRQKNAIKEKLRERGIPDDIADVLIAGVGPSEERPSARELLESFQTALGNLDQTT